jgi:hypothetical protein
MCPERLGSHAFVREWWSQVRRAGSPRPSPNTCQRLRDMLQTLVDDVALWDGSDDPEGVALRLGTVVEATATARLSSCVEPQRGGAGRRCCRALLTWPWVRVALRSCVCRASGGATQVKPRPRHQGGQNAMREVDQARGGVRGPSGACGRQGIEPCSAAWTSGGVVWGRSRQKPIGKCGENRLFPLRVQCPKFKRSSG